MSFASLGLSPSLVQAATGLGFATPTPVQAQAIPALLQGRDVLATAQTGSGKTAAFALPLLAQLPSRPPRSGHGLVLAPTRELAVQAAQVLRDLARGLARPPKIALAFGGVSINPQMLALRGGADVVVATPGRLLDLVEHNALQLGAVGLLVLDEADRLLDLGFAEELRRVLALLPASRQTALFSATFPPAVQALAQGLLREPLRIAVADTPTTLPDIRQRAIQVDEGRRTALLRRLLEDEGWERVLVFVASKHAADHVAWKLHQQGIYATPFHGGLSQGARRKVLEDFKDGGWDVVVTTDLAARGIDIARLPVVVNYDLPRSPVDHVHRIGRTGRAGASGLAVSFVTPAMEAHFRLIEKRQGQAVPREQVAGFEPTGQPPAGPGAGGIKGKRPSKKDKLRAAAAAAATRSDDGETE